MKVFLKTWKMISFGAPDLHNGTMDRSWKSLAFRISKMQSCITAWKEIQRRKLCRLP